MSITSLFELSVASLETGLSRVTFPNINLNTVIFDRDEPYLYVIDESYLHKFAYQLKIIW